MFLLLTYQQQHLLDQSHGGGVHTNSSKNSLHLYYSVYFVLGSFVQALEYLQKKYGYHLWIDLCISY